MERQRGPVRTLQDETTLNTRLPRERRADLMRGLKIFGWAYLGAAGGIFSSVFVLYLIGWDR